MRTALLSLVAIAILAAPAGAQVRVVRPWYWGPGVTHPGWGWGWGGWGYGGAVSATGDAMRGRAEVLRGAGEFNRATSEAMINYEQARSQYIDNNRKWIETRLETQRMGRAAREEYFAERRAARQPWLEANRAAAAARRASPTQVDPSTGKIYWPAALLTDEFAEDRAQMEELLALRAHTTTTTEIAQQIYLLAHRMLDKLKAKITELPANDYLEARKLLDQLANEGQYAAR